MTLEKCIEEFVEKTPFKEPVTTDEIYEYVLSKIPSANKASFNSSLQRFEKSSPDFARYKKGIYFKKKQTLFGETGISIIGLIRKTYLFDGDDIIGFERGPSFMNKIGLTTQIPRYLYLATMKTRYSRIDKEFSVCLSKPVTEINKENYHYLQFLDVLQNKDEVNIEVGNPLEVMRGLMEKLSLSPEKLVFYAKFYKSMQVYTGLSDILGGTP